MYFLSFLFIGLYAAFQWIISFFGFIDPFISQFVGSNGLIARPNAFAYEPSFYVLCVAPFVSLILFSYVTDCKNQDIDCLFLRKNCFLFLISNFFILISMTTSSLLFYLFLFVCLCFFSLFRVFFGWKKIMGKTIALFMGLVIFFKILPYDIKFFFLKFFFHPIHSLESFSDRFSGIEVALKIWLKYPICGVGLGNIPSYCYKEFILGSTEMLYRCTDMVKTENILKIFEPSNVLTELLASLGLLGFLSFSFFFLVIWRYFLLAYKKRPFFSVNLMISVIVMLFLLQINQGLLRTYVWVHLGIVFGSFECICEESLITNYPGAVSQSP